MSFIYGTVCPNSHSVNNDFKALKSVLNTEISSAGSSFGGAAIDFSDEYYGKLNINVGYTHKESRAPRAGIYQDADVLVIADIRIYNYQELKKHISFDTPQECLATAYKKWGVDFASKINGDFAAMIYDKKCDKVHLIRDHIGVRPLSYSLNCSKLIFAPDEFSLARSGIVDIEISEEYIARRLLRYSREYEKTVFNGIEKVLPGYVFTFSKGELIEKYKYWRPEDIVKNSSLKAGEIKFGEAVLKLRELLSEATINRLENLPVALHVSGGIDSTGVASLVANLANDISLLTGYSYSPEELNDIPDEVNEKEYVAAFEEDKGIPVKYQSFTSREYFENAISPEFSFQHIEHPTMKQAAIDDKEILFSGWGGDEFLSLSNRGVVNHLFFKFKWRELIKFAASKGIISTILKFRGEVLPYLIPFGLLKTYKLQRTDWSTLKLFKPSFIFNNFKTIVLSFNKMNLIFSYGDRKKFVLNLINLRHLPTRMDTHSVNSEKYGIEYRYPLLDKKVLEYWFTLPVEFTYHDFKSRQLFREITTGILTDKVRLRGDKTDNTFTNKIYQIRLNSKNELIEMLEATKDKRGSKIFNHLAVVKLLEKPVLNKDPNTIRNFEKIFEYIRFTKLIKKYSNGSKITN